MDQPDPTEWQKRQWHEAEREHDRQAQIQKTHSDQVEAFSLLGIRSLGLTAAGGIAAVLAFYSANYSHLRADPGNLKAFNGILGCLFAALLASLICTLCAYLSQTHFMAAMWKRQMTWQYPYVDIPDESQELATRGSGFRIAAIVLAILSAVFLVVAGLSFFEMLS